MENQGTSECLVVASILCFTRFDAPLLRGSLVVHCVGINVLIFALQSILTLVHIRRSHHLFPIRAYLPTLVAALEDTDGNVRECARTSVVELFTSPGVTDAARADLKKEMTKKGVRKNTLDSVLSKVLLNSSTASTQSDGSENGDVGGKKDYVPPSLALSGRRPTATSIGSGTGSGPSTVPRTMSRGSVRETSRPPSRATTVVSPSLAESAGPGAAPTGSAMDIRPVYVSAHMDVFYSADLTLNIDCLQSRSRERVCKDAETLRGQPTYRVLLFPVLMEITG